MHVVGGWEASLALGIARAVLFSAGAARTMTTVEACGYVGGEYFEGLSIVRSDRGEVGIWNIWSWAHS